MQLKIDTNTADLLRVLVLGLAGFLAVALFMRSVTAFSMLIAAGFLALVISPVVESFMQRFPSVTRKMATTAVFVLMGTVVGFIFAMVVPLVTEQARELARRLPFYLFQLENSSNGLEILGADIPELIGTLLSELEKAVVVTVDLTVSAAKTLISNVIIFVLTILISFAMVVEGPNIISNIQAIVPRQHRRHINQLSGRMHRAITGFMGGQLIITSIAASTTLVVAIILGLPAPLSLTAVIWLTGLIPLVGNTIGASLVVLVAASQSFYLALGIAIFYIVYQQIENNVLEPYIQAHRVKLSPLYVLLSALAGVHVAGFLGALLAIPAGACVRILIDDYIGDKGD